VSISPQGTLLSALGKVDTIPLRQVFCWRLSWAPAVKGKTKLPSLAPADWTPPETLSSRWRRADSLTRIGAGEGDGSAGEFPRYGGADVPADTPLIITDRVF
jgi:hypothetical protein